MRKLLWRCLWCLLLGSTVSYAGVIKIRNAGQPDVYVPTMDSDNTSNLTVKGKVVSPIGNITTVNATTVAATNLTGLGTVPVGSIVQSILTLAQFQAQAGTNWVLMDGASIVGSRLATITGWTNLPDASGKFLRTAGSAGAGLVAVTLATRQEQATAKNKLVNAASSVTGSVGSSDGTHTHTDSGHQHGQTYSIPGSGGGTASGQGTSSFMCNNISYDTNIPTRIGYAAITTSGSGHGHGFSLTAPAQIISSTDTETRPVNLTVNTFIRIN